MKITFETILHKLFLEKDLSIIECDYLVKSIFEDDINEISLASILTLLRQKNESFEEILTFTKFLKKKAKKINIKGILMDTCGTGGDNKNSFNFSTATSILLASCDVKIAKHGNRSVTSKSGSFDILESLGIKISPENSDNQKFFKTHGICFLFAPNFHSSLKKVSNVRKNLPFKTIFNLLGPLLNPTQLTYQLLGVSNECNLITHAKCLKDSKIKKGWVVYNKNGYDELTTTAENLVIEIKNNKISKEFVVKPTEIGFKIREESELIGGSPEENAFILRRVFEGETGAIRDNIILNTAAGLLISEQVKNLKDGIDLASQKIDSGFALNKLNLLISK